MSETERSRNEVDARKDKYHLGAIMFQEVTRALGLEKASQILGPAFVRYQEEKLSKDLIEDMDGRTFEDFVAWAKAQPAKRLHFHVEGTTDDAIRLRFDYCPSAQALRELDGPELAQLYCDSDPGLARGINPELRSEMEKCWNRGDGYCLMSVIRQR